MKTVHCLLMVALCCFCASTSWAQQPTSQPNASPTTAQISPEKECRTVAGQAEIDYENKVDRAAFKKQMEYYLSRTDKRAIQQYAIQLHIVRMDDGTGGIDVADIRSEIENFVNPYFADIDIEFVECNPEMYHDRTEYYVLGGGEDPDVAGDAMSAEYNVANVINIYFVSDPDGACGWARFPWKLPVDYIVIANSCADNNSTLVHELGHYYGLYHTHETFGGMQPESVTRNNADGCWDCETDGDILCDTPADPNLTSTANNFPDCGYTGSGTDECGVSYNPAIDNIMSYADKRCRTVFSPQQLARMEVYRDGDRSYLQNGCPCERPVATCKNITVNLNAAGNASITPSSVDNGSTWDCGFGSWSVSPNTFNCSDVGGNAVTLTLTDALGWVSTCSATVTISDVTDPVITNPASSMTVECDGGGNIVAFSNWLVTNGGATASDACGGSWSNNSVGLSDRCGATGTEMVTFTYTDPSGNTASTTATFTIEDTTNPSLTCPENIHLPECVETASWTAIASDVCGDVTVVSVPPSGSVFEKGTTTIVTVTATDDCGNETECTFEVTRDPDLVVAIDPLATSSLNTCALGNSANIVLGYGGGPTCITLNAVGSGGHGPYTYAWDAPAQVPIGYFTGDDTATPTFCAGFQTEACAIYTFLVTVTDIHGCTETNTVEVSVVNPLCTEGPKAKVWICHHPSGNPSNEQSICVGQQAVYTHLYGSGHDDCLGHCDATCATYSALAEEFVAGNGNKIGLATNSQFQMADSYQLSIKPNPFSSTAVVSFSTDFATNARLIVLDVNGQQVANLFDGPVQKNTPHTVNFEAGNLLSGIYFARLIGEDGTSISSTVLLVR